MKKTIPPYYTINWDFNGDTIEFYDVMPALVRCWNEEKERKYKIWNMKFDDVSSDNKMPETFNEFKRFVDAHSQDRFSGDANYESVLCGWPVHKNEYKLDVYEQIKANLDVVTKHFMDYIKG